MKRIIYPFYIFKKQLIIHEQKTNGTIRFPKKIVRLDFFGYYKTINI